MHFANVGCFVVILLANYCILLSIVHACPTLPNWPIHSSTTSKPVTTTTPEATSTIKKTWSCDGDFAEYPKNIRFDDNTIVR